MIRWRDCDDETWRSLLAGLPHDFYDLIEYVKLDAASEGGESLALAAQLETHQLLLPLVVRSIPGNLRCGDGFFDARSPYGYPGILHPPDLPVGALDTLLKSIQSMGRSRGIVSTFLRFHPLFNAPLSSIESSPGIDILRRGLTVSTDLTLPIEDLESQIRASIRRDIRKLRASGFVARFDDWKDYTAFQRMYRQTMERNDASSRYIFDETYFDALARLLGHRLHLCSVVSPAGKIAAAGLFVRTGDIVQYHLGASDTEFLRVAPSKLSIYAAIRWFQEAGATRLHLGGGLGTAKDSLYTFKRGFCTDTHEFVVAQIIHDLATYERLVKQRVSREAGRESSANFFPAYRAF